MVDQVYPPAGASNINEVAELGTGGCRDDESVEQYMLRLQEEAAELRALLASERQERDQLARAAPGATIRLAAGAAVRRLLQPLTIRRGLCDVAAVHLVGHAKRIRPFRQLFVT